MAELQFTITQSQYESLVALAREGAKLSDGTTDTDKLRRIDEFLRMIERQNGVTRDIVWVQWQEADAPLPAGTQFPDRWPPEMRRKVELVTRRVARADIDAVLSAHAKNPLSVLCTKDPAGVLGYTPIDQFFVV